jgi:DNA-binding PadR family transcriptional regulator
MRRPIDAAEPVRYFLLGLLLDGPSHGYDLARTFGPATVVGNVVHLGASHLYALLTRLERDGLIAGERREQGIRPPRRVYRLTEAGRAAFWRWLDEPVARPRDVLLDFPLKLYLAQRLAPERALTLVAHQRALFVAYLADLEQEPQPEGPAVDRTFLCLLREARIDRTRSTLAWLDRCAEALAATAPGVP